MTLTKRFSDVSSFQQERTYSLLPIRFTPLDDERFVITNMASEFMVVKKDELVQIVENPNDVNEELKKKLLTKSMIYEEGDELPIKLTGLKYKTKISRLKDFTSLHMIVATLRCDYTCNYCQVSRQNLSADSNQFDMSIETAEKALDFIFKSPSKFIKIEFQGGESLLNFSLIRYVVERAEIISREKRRSVQYVIATNLSPINQEILDFCKQHSIYISTSLDGPKELHDKNRPKPEKNGYDLTIAGINKVKSSLGVDHISALMTSTSRSLDFYKEIVDEYVKNDLHAIFIRPLSPFGFAVTKGHIYKYDTETWLDFFKLTLSYIIEINKQGYRLIEQYSSIILTKMLTPKDLGYVHTYVFSELTS